LDLENMSDPDEQQEPSMEEILASIRRIISEEDEDERPDGETAENAGPEEVPAEAATDDEPATADAEPAPDEEASEADIEALMADSGPAPESDADDVLELTEEVQDDGTVVDLDASRESAEPAEGGGDDADDDAEDDDAELMAVDIEEAAPETASEPAPDSEPEPAAASAAQEIEGLVSPPIATEATSTFAEFVSAVEQGRIASSSGIGGRTVEEVVKEVIRPLVKDWLDANLPALVERLVSREIDRMSRRAEDQVPD
jgi:uncharacterized protein